MSSYRRPKHHTYDYNYKVGESSYRDMLDYLDKKEGRRAVSPPPGKKTFAERFAERPIYGELRPLQLSQREPPDAERWTSRPAERVRASPRPSEPRPSASLLQDEAPGERRPRGSLLRDSPPAERKSRAAPNEAALEMDPEELIASIRRGRAARLELLSSLEDEAADEEAGSRRRRPLRMPSEEPEETPAGRLRQLRLADDQEEGVSSSRALASSSFSASSMRSSSSKQQSSSSTTTRSVRYE